MHLIFREYPIPLNSPIVGFQAARYDFAEIGRFSGSSRLQTGNYWSPHSAVARLNSTVNLKKIESLKSLTNFRH